MKTTLPDGTTIEGTPEQIGKILKALGPTAESEEYYYSESRGEYLYIPTMNNKHIRNALLKLYQAWFQTLYDTDNIPDFLRAIATGLPMTPNVRGFLATLNARRLAGKKGWGD